MSARQAHEAIQAGENRTHAVLQSACPEDSVGEDNPAQVLDTFVNEFDLAASGFAGVDPAATGRRRTTRPCS